MSEKEAQAIKLGDYIAVYINSKYDTTTDLDYAGYRKTKQETHPIEIFAEITYVSRRTDYMQIEINGHYILPYEFEREVKVQIIK
ncbi:MAG: hypothetical protein OXB92_17365 [Acidimicrobiaceae bacterium]|nr:hypothetical protein [Acidimicrobiaceae bacterium]